jgi:hypothetical protein
VIYTYDNPPPYGAPPWATDRRGWELAARLWRSHLTIPGVEKCGVCDGTQPCTVFRVAEDVIMAYWRIAMQAWKHEETAFDVASQLYRAAESLIERHGVSLLDTGWCDRCGEPYPCQPLLLAYHAQQLACQTGGSTGAVRAAV